MFAVHRGGSRNAAPAKEKNLLRLQIMADALAAFTISLNVDIQDSDDRNRVAEHKALAAKVRLVKGHAAPYPAIALGYIENHKRGLAVRGVQVSGLGTNYASDQNSGHLLWLGAGKDRSPTYQPING